MLLFHYKYQRNNTTQHRPSSMTAIFEAARGFLSLGLEPEARLLGARWRSLGAKS